MELFLNLCWLALLLPAYLLWRQRISSDRSPRTSWLVMGTLGCALILLFPVVSVSDDLQAVGQAMEESERALRQDAKSVPVPHSLTHVSPLLASMNSLSVAFVQVGTVLPPPSRALHQVVTGPTSGRAPPQYPVAL